MEKKEKSGSKTNLNESALPLLDDTEKDLKKGEMEETTFSDEKTGDEGDSNNTKKDKKKDKKKKEKKVKEPKEKKEKKDNSDKHPVFVAQKLSVGLNVLDRDEKHLNDFVNVNFEDIIAEPDSSQGFEFFWRVTFLTFSTIRGWLYTILAAVLAFPLAIVWAVIFALLNVVSVWFLTPVLRIYDIVLHVIHRIWSGLVRTVLDPFAKSGALLFNNIYRKTDGTCVTKKCEEA